MRRQLHHRACHRRVLQHGAGIRGAAGQAGGGRELSLCLRRLEAGGGRLWTSEAESLHAPFSERFFQLHFCTPLRSLSRAPPALPVIFFFMALLSCLAPVVREPRVRINPFFQFGSFRDVSSQEQLLFSCLGSLWRDAPGSHCAFFCAEFFGLRRKGEPWTCPGLGPLSQVGKSFSLNYDNVHRIIFVQNQVTYYEFFFLLLLEFNFELAPSGDCEIWE